MARMRSVAGLGAALLADRVWPTIGGGRGLAKWLTISSRGSLSSGRVLQADACDDATLLSGALRLAGRHDADRVERGQPVANRRTDRRTDIMSGGLVHYRSYQYKVAESMTAGGSPELDYCTKRSRFGEHREAETDRLMRLLSQKRELRASGLLYEDPEVMEKLEIELTSCKARLRRIRKEEGELD
jgi:hypothetical protein